MDPDPEEQQSNLAELKEAIREEDDERFRWLLNYQLDCQGSSSLPPWFDYDLLVLAIELEYYHCVKVLLEKGCRVMKPGCIDTPLHSIARNTKLAWWDLMEEFLKLGARVSDADGLGNSVVHLINNSICTAEVYDLLLRQHQQETTENVKNRDGLSFLHIACTLPDMELVKKCLDYNREDVNCQISAISSFYHGFTPLHFAIEFNNYEAVKLLLSYGADLQIPNADGSYPVHFALKKTMLHHQKTAILDLLVAHNFIMENIVDNNGRSLLMCACAASSDTYFGNQTVFVECKNDADNDGNTPLHYAARFRRQKMVNKLLETGAQCCAKNNKGQTPLAMAQQQGHKDVCNLLELHCRCNQPTVG